jgi:hypothetical protein
MSDKGMLRKLEISLALENARISFSFTLTSHARDQLLQPAVKGV